MKFIRQTQRRDYFRRLQAQTYQSRHFGNPLFPKKRQPLPAKYAIFGLIIGVVVALVSFFFTSSAFKISAVRIDGTETIPSKAIVDAANRYLDEPRLLIFSASNRFLFNAGKFTSRLSESFSFDHLDVALDHNELVISVVERVSTFVWAAGEDLYLIDRGGVVIRQISTEEYGLIDVLPPVQGPVAEGETLPGEVSLLRFVDLADQKVEIGKSVLSGEEIETIFEFLEALKSVSVQVNELEIDRTMGSWMSAVTSVGYRVYFDPASDPTAQTTRLEAVLRDTVSDPSVLEYVDLRFEDHVYVK